MVGLILCDLEDIVLFKLDFWVFQLNSLSTTRDQIKGLDREFIVANL